MRTQIIENNATYARENFARQRIAAKVRQDKLLVDKHMGVSYESEKCWSNLHRFDIDSTSIRQIIRRTNISRFDQHFSLGNSLDSSNVAQSEAVKLRHPASNKPTVFVFSPGNITVQEVLIFDENKRSWFIDDNVKSDGKLHLSTPIDPIFLVLPYLRKSQLAQPLEQCLWDEDFPETSRLAQCENLKLLLVADCKGDQSLQAYKYNEEKSLKWLQKKVERVADLLRQKGVHVSQGAMSATYVKSTKYEIGTETEYLKYAHGIISEYLAEDLSQKLAQHLNISDETESKKRKLDSPKNITNEKKLKRDSFEESPIPKAKTKNLLIKPEKIQKHIPGKKELAKQRAAAGSKSITSFFQKK